MRFLLAIVVGAALTLALLSAPAADQIAAERTAQVQAQEAARTAQVQAQEAARTERLALQEAARTERLALQEAARTERAATLQYTLTLVVVAGIVVIVAWLRRPAAPAMVYLAAPPDVLRQLAATPGHKLEYDQAEGWIVVLPGDREYYTEQDARRLLSG